MKTEELEAKTQEAEAEAEAETEETEAKEAKSKEVVTKDEAEESSTVEVIYVEVPEMEVTATSPLVIILTWAMTSASAKVFARSKFQKARHLLPVVALLSAVALQAVIENFYGTGFNIESVGKALGAGGLAVLGHSQFREFKKAVAKISEEAPAQDSDPSVTEED